MIDYYSNLFTSNYPSVEDILKITNLIPSLNPELFSNHLSSPFSAEEVRKALFDLNPAKAPGPDGFMALFFQNAWDTLGSNISNAVLRVLNNEEPMKDWNSTESEEPLPY